MNARHLGRLAAAALATVAVFAAGPALAGPRTPHSKISWSAEGGPISQAETNLSPGLGSVKFPGSATTRELLAWKGSSTDRVFYAYSKSASYKSWSNQSAIPSALTSQRPDAAGYGHHVVVVWKGKTTNHIFYSVGNAKKNGTLSWSAQKTVPAALTTLGPSVYKARYSNILLLTWKGQSTDNIDYLLGTPTTTGIIWGSQAVLPHTAATAFTPTIAEAKTGKNKGLIFIFWRGVTQSRPFYETTTDPVATSPAWTPEVGFPFSVSTSNAPVATAAGKNGTFPLVVAYKDLSSTALGYVTLSQSGKVGTPGTVPMTTSSLGPALFRNLLVATQPAPGRINFNILK